MARGVEVWPVRTNAAFLARALEDEDFADATLDTGFIARKIDALVPPAEPTDETWATAAAFALAASADDTPDLPRGFRLNAAPRLSASLTRKGETRTVRVDDNTPIARASAAIDNGQVLLFQDGQAFAFDLAVRGTGAAAAGDGAILAPMPGKVIALDVADGESVTKGQRLMVLEAMKMEHALIAPFDGTITDLAAAQGSQVQVEQVLAVVEPRAAD